MIPKTAHFYWGRNAPLSFMRSLSVRSFALYNPDWRVIVWQPKTTTAGTPWATREHKRTPGGVVDHFDGLADVAELRTFDFDSIPNASNLPEVIKSDILRWHLLFMQGGLWSDTDVLYVRPVNELRLSMRAGGYLSRHVDQKGDEFYTIGLMLAKPVNPFFGKVFADAVTKRNPREYQSAGRIPLERRIAAAGLPPDVKLLPPHCIYPVNGWQDRRLHSGDHLDLRRDCVGIHWFGGSWRLPDSVGVVDSDTLDGYCGPLFRWAQKVCRDLAATASV